MGTNSGSNMAVESITWQKDHVKILDQTYLPKREVYTEIRDVGRMWESIKKLRIQGAPALGIAAGYGLYLGVKELPESSFQSFSIEIKRISDYLKNANPTSANIGWAVDRIQKTIGAHKDKDIEEIKEIILETAQTIHAEDRRICKQIGEEGEKIIEKSARILTHGNTGSLSSSQYGTALSAIFHAHENDKNIKVWVDETRPRLQGARLTAWELMNAEIPMELIVDSAAASLMKENKVDMVMVGADRVAANGDVANKIGTYPLAVLAHENEVPFYVALPTSTIDTELESGEDIPIEEREDEEITQFNDSKIAPKKAEAYNPSSDVTPHSYITGFITEQGLVEPPFDENFKKLFEG